MDNTPDEAWDQSWGTADPAQAAAAGRDLVSMYLSHDPSKNVTAAKVKAYHAHGIGVLLNWEAQAGAPLQGAAQGAADGADAAAQVLALIGSVGEEPDSQLAIVFSCDVDTNPGQYPQIDAYFKAAKAALAGRFLLGVYGEADLIDHLASTGITDMEWQTYAWSAGRISKYTDFYQYLNGQQLGGASVDFDRVLRPESVGAWWPANHPLNSQEADMPTAKEIATATADEILGRVLVTNDGGRQTVKGRIVGTQTNTSKILALLNPDALADAVVAKLQANPTAGTLSKDDVTAAVRAVFADAGDGEQ